MVKWSIVFLSYQNEVASCWRKTKIVWKWRKQIDCAKRRKEIMIDLIWNREYRLMGMTILSQKIKWLDFEQIILENGSFVVSYE